MSKGNKKKKIIAGIATSVVLVTAATVGILSTTEIESEKEKEKRNKVSIRTISEPTKINVIDEEKDLAFLLPDSQRNLGVLIVDQGNDFIVEQIKDILTKKNIDISQIEIEKVRLKMATIKPIAGSKKYQGKPVVLYFTSDVRQPLSWVIVDSKRNLGTIFTDGDLRPTIEQIKDIITTNHIDVSQVEIINIEENNVTIKSIPNSTKYRDSAITLFFNVDYRQNLATLLSTNQQKNLGTIIMNGELKPTVQEIKNLLVKNGIDVSQVEIINIEENNVTIKPIANSTKYRGDKITTHFKIANSSQDLTKLLPVSTRNFGKIYLGQEKINNNDREEKIRLAIADIISNKYNIDISNIVIKIASNQTQALITSLNKAIYTGEVNVNYQIDTSFVTLDYLVPDMSTRQQQVATHYFSHHEDIINVKNDIFNDNEFRNLPEINNFVNELSEKVKYKANHEAINSFIKLENDISNFKDFEDLKQQLYQHHNSFKGKLNLDDFITTLTNYYNNYNKVNYYQQVDVNFKINQLKKGICRFYNILAQIYGKNNVFRMLQKIELDQQFFERSSYQFVRTSILRFL